MWVRSGFWVGAPLEGAEDRFRQVMDGELLPIMRDLPGVQAVRILWPAQREGGAPAIACQVLLEFASREDVEVMLASPERARMREHALALNALFEGSLSHIEFEVSSSAEKR